MNAAACGTARKKAVLARAVLAFVFDSTRLCDAGLGTNTFAAFWADELTSSGTGHSSNVRSA